MAPESLRQPDGTSCGPMTVLAARILLEPTWRPDDVRAEVARLHRRLTSTRSHRDRFQAPWPRRLGTPPWAVAGALSVLTGERIATVNARPRPRIAYDVLTEQVRTRPAAVYLGNRWLPRHVVLAFAAEADGSAVRVFDPARGALLTVPRERWQRHDVRVAGWRHFWAVV